MSAEITPYAQWLDLLSNPCVLEYEDAVQSVRAAVDLIEAAYDADGRVAVRLAIYPEQPLIVAPPPAQVQLIVIAQDVTYTLTLAVADFNGAYLTIVGDPLSVVERFLRRAPRTPYPLGPCAAVVHSSEGTWRGVVEFWLRDVSAEGVGFKVETGNAYMVGIGDSLRAPVTLPDGRRSWVDGKVVWLSQDGRGGLSTRKAPQWTPGDYVDAYAS